MITKPIKISEKVLAQAKKRIGRRGKLYILGEKSGVLSVSVKLTRYGGCDLTPGISSTHLEKSFFSLSRKGYKPAAFLKIEARYVKAPGVNASSGGYGDFSYKFPQTPVFQVDRWDIKCIKSGQYGGKTNVKFQIIKPRKYAKRR